MITYNPKTWFQFIFTFHKNDSFRTLLPSLIALVAITSILVFVEVNYFNIQIKNITFFHQVIGFILSMLLVFRINTAYDRWWEGRKAWGALLNNSRNLSIKIGTFLPKEMKEEKQLLSLLISNYPFVLKEHLRDNFVADELQFSSLFTQDELAKVSHKPNYIAKRINQELTRLQKSGVMETEHLLLLNEELRSFTDVSGICERIKSTPIPYSYSLYLKRIIFLYVITMPVVFAIDFKYWAILFVALIFYSFATLELISEEIEDPFGKDDNDLPTDEIAAKIKLNVEEILLS